MFKLVTIVLICVLQAVPQCATIDEYGALPGEGGQFLREVGYED